MFPRGGRSRSARTLIQTHAIRHADTELIQCGNPPNDSLRTEVLHRKENNRQRERQGGREGGRERERERESEREEEGEKSTLIEREEKARGARHRQIDRLREARERGRSGKRGRDR